jgi:hypothetical protein
MADNTALPQSWIKDFPLGFDETGSPLVPTNPALALARLAKRQADPGYIESLTNPKHPLFQLRTEERRGLQVSASRAASALPKTPQV